MSLPSALLRSLRKIVGSGGLDTDYYELLVYQSDGLTLHSANPGAVVYPESTLHVSRIVKLCARAGVPCVPRGAGTGLSGGAVSEGGVIIQLSRMNQILAVHPRDRYAVVQPGVVNNYLSTVTRQHRLAFAPDPSSQAACTIGGNLAENAGGPHTLKYGVTVNHILGQTVVLADGEIVTLGGALPVTAGPDFSAFLVGNEGTLAVTTEIIVRLTPLPDYVTTMLAVYSTIEGATESVTGILGAGVLPAAMEMIDNLCIQAVESHIKAGFPTDAEAVLLIELDGDEAQVKQDQEQVERACLKQGATEFHTAQSEEERQRLWRGRKHAVGALGRITPSFYTNDGVVPRSRLTDILRSVYRIGEQHGLRVASVCHAGDGNIHPLILFDSREQAGASRAIACSEEILLACLEMGGSLTGEHGIGLEKRELLAHMFAQADLDHQRRIRDELNPHAVLNPMKLFPTGAGCGELRGNTTVAGGWI